MQFRRQLSLLAGGAVMVLLVLFLWSSAAGDRRPNSDEPRDAAKSLADHEDVNQRIQRDMPPLDTNAAALTHLVLVPGHGTIKGPDFSKYKDEEQWALEPFQVGKNLPAAFVAHIRRGVELAAKDPTSVLIFSGGQTRADSGTRSEAQTYMDIAVVNPSDFPGATSLMDANPRRIFAEDSARDSYENLLFSIARFYEATGHFPTRITVVGFAYKERRFVDLHRIAVRWPLSKFTYIGIDAKPTDGKTATTLSDAATVAKVREDLYMCKLGQETRAKRNPNRRSVPYYMSVPAEVRALLLWCGPKLFRGPLPWTSTEP